MVRILILIILNIILFKQIFAEDIVYEPEEWRSDENLYYFEIVYMWYDKNDDYVILIDNGDHNMNFFKDSPYKYALFEIRGIDPKTIKMQGFGEGKVYIGKRKENYDCSKFEFYEKDYDWNARKSKKTFKPKGACFGYKDYSYKDLEEMGIIINIIDSYEITNNLKK